MRVLNCHTAPIEGIAPGAEGDLPDAAPVHGLLRAGLLREAGGPADPPSGPTDNPAELRALFDREWRRRAEDHRAQVDALEAGLRERDARVAALEAELAALKAPAEKPEAEKPAPSKVKTKDPPANG